MFAGPRTNNPPNKSDVARVAVHYAQRLCSGLMKLFNVPTNREISAPHKATEREIISLAILPNSREMKRNPYNKAALSKELVPCIPAQSTE